MFFGVSMASVASLGLASVAYAYWNANASGTAATKAVTAQALTVQAVAAPVAELFPGLLGGLQFTVTNPNPYGVSLTGWSLGTITSSDPTNCPVSNVSLPVSTGTLGTAVSVPAHGTSSAVTLPGVLQMITNAANGCQGVSFNVALSLSGTQV